MKRSLLSVRGLLLNIPSTHEQTKFVLGMEQYSVQAVREALNASLAEYEPLTLVVAAMATCFLLFIVTSTVSSAVLVLSDHGTSHSPFL